MSMHQRHVEESNDEPKQRRQVKTYTLVMRKHLASKDCLLLTVAVVLGMVQILRVVQDDRFWLNNRNATLDTPSVQKRIKQSQTVPSVWTRATTGCVEPQSEPFSLPASTNTEIALNVSKSLYDRVDKSELDAIGCTPSTMMQSVEIIPGCGHWEVQTFDALSHPKGVGGDEFYVTYTDDAVKQSQQHDDVNHPTAVAEVTYLQDGRYRLDFVSSPLNHRGHRLAGKGTIDIYFQYTCGIGEMNPPSKNDPEKWKDGGNIAVHYSQENVVVPPIQPFQPTKSTVDLSKYSVVIPLGDSLMQQFAKPLNINPPNLAMPLNNVTINAWISKLRNSPWLRGLFEKADHLRHVQQHMQKWQPANRTNIGDDDSQKVGVFVIGSHAWDLLSKEGFQGEDGHAQGIVQLVKHIHANYPHFDVVWKSPCAMSVHVPMLQSDDDKHNLGEKIDKKFGGSPLERLNDRIRYMSESRTRNWFNIQKRITAQLNIPFLDIYQASYLSSDHLKHRDGRHFEDNLHQMAINWFTSESPLLGQAAKLLKGTPWRDAIMARENEDLHSVVKHFSSQHGLESHDSAVIAVHEHPSGSKPNILPCIQKLRQAALSNSMTPECNILFISADNAKQWEQEVETLGCKASTMPSVADCSENLPPDVFNFVATLNFIAGLAHDGYILPTNTLFMPPNKYLEVIHYAKTNNAWRQGALPIDPLPHCFWDSQLPGIA